MSMASAVSSTCSVQRDGGLDRVVLVGVVMMTGRLLRMFAVNHSLNQACQIVLPLVGITPSFPKWKRTKGRGTSSFRLRDLENDYASTLHVWAKAPH